MVVSVVDESLGDAAEVFEGCVDGFGGAACGVGVVDVGQDVPGSVFECCQVPGFVEACLGRFLS